MKARTLALLMMASASPVRAADTMEVESPDGRVRVRLTVENGVPHYAVQLAGRDVLLASPLGLRRLDADLTSNLRLISATPSRRIADEYALLHGKARRARYSANRRVFTFASPTGQPLDVAFHVSNDGVAFRYLFEKLPGGEATVLGEETGFALPAASLAWLEPMHDAKTGWSRVNPCYEEHYAVGVSAGTRAPHAAGWAFPALFQTDGAWVLLTESDLDDGYCAARLRPDAPGALYRIGFPQAGEHRGEIDPVSPTIRAPFASPWRVIVLGDTLGPIVESTLVTDVARAPQMKTDSFVAPGRAAWSWLQLDDASCTLPVQKQFLELASKLGWEYLLVDSMWDRQIGWEGIEQLVALGRAKGVGLWLWYNSNGGFNDAPMTPKDRMHEPTVRREEMERLQKAGIRGIKVDFMGGDKQATMKLYLDILKDAADHSIMVNFHGATIPRGWARTFPHLMSMEAVKGMEFVGFEQANADRQPEHCAILPFTRNAIGAMDFTPTVFNPKVRRIDRRTSDAFELALAVLFESGVQHMGLTPQEVDGAPDFVVEMLRSIPPAWDEVRFVNGFPGRHAVLARRAGTTWFVAGINGGSEPRALEMDLSFAASSLQGSLVRDGENGRGFVRQALAGEPARSFTLTLAARGGFLMRIESR
jgi:hypothetical protein